MTDIFVALDAGTIVAFWEIDNKISIYDPGNICGNNFVSLTRQEIERDHNPLLLSENTSDEPDDTIKYVIKYFSSQFKHLNRRDVRLSNVLPGTYYPRIWRGIYELANPLAARDLIDPNITYRKSYNQSVVSANSLLSQLSVIFNTLEPSTANLNAYGHRLRELLILVCTEIESGWRGILEKNSDVDYISKKAGRYTTKDYIKTKDALRLQDWELTMVNYPDLGVFCPYKHWDADRPTESIAWYSAYNACKHDREGEFQRANLSNLINASAALHILMAAQWGPANFGGSGLDTLPFQFANVPQWAVEEVYLPSPSNGNPIETKLFQSA